MSEDRLGWIKRHKMPLRIVMSLPTETVTEDWAEAIDWLISEVEQLREFAEQVDAGLLQRDEQIASLTKERDELKKILAHEQSLNEMNHRFYVEKIKKLEAEIEELKKRLGEIK